VAKRELSRALAELEAVVGRELLTTEAPLLPDVSAVELSREEGSAVRRLLAAPPSDWTGADRTLLEAALANNREALAELDREPRTRFAMESLQGFLRAGRLLSLEARSALDRGDEVAFAQGIERSDRLARSLRLQPQFSASLIAVHLQMLLLQDVQIAATGRATGEATLTALEWALAEWRELPDPAATLAREALFSLRAAPEGRRARPRDLASADVDAVETAMHAAAAHDWAVLALRCREAGSRQAARELADAFENDTGPYRVVSEMLFPNLMDGLAKLEVLTSLTELARAAIALRLAALESGAYPATLEDLPATVAAGRGEIPGLHYHRADGAARLELVSEPRQGGLTAELAKRLQTWQLPAVTPLQDR
jgi:hypothetical protein